MPWGLKRFQESHSAHFITFSCYRRQPNLAGASSRDLFEETLERTRRWYGLSVYAYVVMPEHIHLLVGEPERAPLSVAIQMLKQVTSRKLRPRRPKAVLAGPVLRLADLDGSQAHRKNALHSP